MHVAVIYFYKNKKELLLKIARGMAKGIQAQGHQADIIDGNKEADKSLFIYKYIVIGVEAISVFGGKLPVGLMKFLKNASRLAGKRSCAFTNKSLLGSEKTLSNIMKAMEGEGMFLTYSEIFKDDIYAEEVGKKLIVVRK